MSDPADPLLGLHDPRLAPHVASPYPAWLWSLDGAQLHWANAAGAALLGAPNAAAIASLEIPLADPLRRQVAQLSGRLAPSGAPRLERLRGFGGPFGRLVTFSCARLVLAGDTVAVLVAATENIGRALPLDERLSRAIEGIATPLAAFHADGSRVAANAQGAALIDAADSLTALGLEDVRADVLRDGRAEMLTATGRYVLTRVGTGADTAIVTRITPLPAATIAVPEEAQSNALALEDNGASPADINNEQTETIAVEVAASSPPPAPTIATTIATTIAPTTTPSPAPASSTPETPASVASSPVAPFSFIGEPPLADRRHPLRFLWQMDAEGRFALGSDEFLRLIGPQTSAALGRPWSEINAVFALDPEDRVAKAVTTHDTWSGIVVQWPVDDHGTRMPVELSGLPVFDRARHFTGYRGFGVCRDLDALAQLASRRRQEMKYADPPRATPADSSAASAAPPALTIVASTEPALESASVPAAVNANIVPFPSAPDTKSPVLSPVENNAFNELARQLSQRLSAPVTEAAAPTPEAIAPEPAPVVAAEMPEPQAPAHTETPASHWTTAEGGTLRETTILDRLPVGVLVYRLDRLIYANRAFLERTGYRDLHALAGAGGLDALFVEQGPASSSDTAETGTPLVLSAAHGGHQPVEARLFSVPWEGESALALIFAPVATVAPVTASTPVATAAPAASPPPGPTDERAARAATRAEAAKDALLTKISHEIRAPMSAIIGFAEVMIDERFGPLGNERYRDYLKDIRASGEHVMAFINELLDLSRIETGKIALTPETLRLNDTVEQCVAVMQPQANRERVIIRTSLATALAPIKADSATLRQLVRNLVVASIRLAQTGGQVIVSTAATDTGDVALRVRDTGPGMSAAEMTAALEPFRLSEDGASSPEHGLGHSVSLIKALAEANGGRFRIQSGAISTTAPSGTLMEVSFPPAS